MPIKIGDSVSRIPRPLPVTADRICLQPIRPNEYRLVLGDTVVILTLVQVRALRDLCAHMAEDSASGAR